MRIILTIETADNKLSLPIHYNYIIQSLIYNSISSRLASFLHKEGYIYGRRSFRLFTFSRLYGKFELNKNRIIFNSPVRLYISSFDKTFIQELAENLIKNNNIKLFRQNLQINSIEVAPTKRLGRETIVKTLSPITIYSTLSTKDGRKKTYYYTPFEKEFQELILENLKKKFKLIHKKAPGRRKLTIEPLTRKSVSEKIIKYKDTVIKGWVGRFKLKGSPDLISIAYDTGLGSKNSQGFGMIEILT